MPAEIYPVNDPEQRLERLRCYEGLLESQIVCFEMIAENYEAMNEIQVLANGAIIPTAPIRDQIPVFREQLEWCRAELAKVN